MKLTTTLQLTALLVLLGSGAVSGQTLLNGSFEIGPDPTPYPGHSIPLDAVDSTSIYGWTVATGSIDYIGDRWLAANGTRSIDLSGLGVGKITQTVSGFEVGQLYRLSFWMAANPEAPYMYPAVRSLTAAVGSTSQNFSFAVDGHTGTDMGWSLCTINFSANSSSMLVSFQSLTDSLAGPALDAVSIQAVPEPGTLALVGLGAVAVFARRFRRNRSR
jgi:choice-of-anchor C domain-containing protein